MVSLTQSWPQNTPGVRVIMRAVALRSAAIRLADRSPEPKSSASAARTLACTAACRLCWDNSVFMNRRSVHYWMWAMASELLCAA